MKEEFPTVIFPSNRPLLKFSFVLKLLRFIHDSNGFIQSTLATAGGKVEVCIAIMRQTMITSQKIQPKLVTVRICETAIASNTDCNTNIKMTTMKSKLFVLALFLLAFSFLYAAQNKNSYSKKAYATETKSNGIIHPVMFPLDAFE